MLQHNIKPNEENSTPLVTTNPNETPHMRVTSFEVMFEMACKHANGEIQRIHGLELAKTSKSEAHFCMQMVNLDIASMNMIDELNQSFAEMACTSLYIFWKDYELVHNTLCNIKRIAQIGSDEVKIGLIERRVVLAASLSVCFQTSKMDKGLNVKLLDENIELVLLTYYHILYRGPTNPVNFHRLLISALMMVVPSIVDSLKRNKSLMGSFAWIFKELFIALHKNFGDDQINQTKNWLKKHGIVDYVFSYLRENQLGISEFQDINLMQLLSMTGFLFKNVKHKTLRSIVPKLMEYLDVDRIASLKSPPIFVQSFKPYCVASVNLKNILKELPDGKVAKNLLTCDLIGTLQKAVNCYPEMQQYVPGLIISFLENIKHVKDVTDSPRSTTLTESQMSSLMINVCNLIEQFLIQSNDLRFEYAKIVCNAIVHYNAPNKNFMLEILENGSFALMMRAYTMLCYSKEGKTDEIDAQSNFGTKIFSFLSCYENKKSMISVLESLPEILVHYSREEHTAIEPQYSRLVTLLVNLSFDNIHDFTSDRWKFIHYLIVLHYVHVQNVMEMPIENLILLWKLMHFDLIETVFSPNLELVEIELKKKAKADAKVIGNVKDLKNKTAESWFELLVDCVASCLKSIREENISVKKLRKTTQLLCDMAADSKVQYQLDMLKGLIFACVDVVRDVKDFEIQKNVNMFVVYLFLNSNQESNSS